MSFAGASSVWLPGASGIPQLRTCRPYGDLHATDRLFTSLFHIRLNNIQEGVGFSSCGFG